MKKLAIVIFTVLFLVSTGFTATYCQWSGSQAENCRTVTSGRIQLPNGLWVAEKDFNEYGYYLLVITQPTLGEYQVRDVVVWDFVNDEITKTWTVRDMTETEIDELIAQAMDLGLYYVYKILVTFNVVTVEQLQNNLPQEVIDAYLARNRLFVAEYGESTIETMLADSTPFIGILEPVKTNNGKAKK